LTKSSTTERVEKAAKYLTQSLRYLENAYAELQKGEVEKSGELLWGSVAEALKAFMMARKGLLIKEHREFRRIARELAKECADESISQVVAEADSLHSNFYEARLEIDDLRCAFERIRFLVEKLKNLTIRELTG
jgi:HEPN domain-containing protein